MRQIFPFLPKTWISFLTIYLKENNIIIKTYRKTPNVGHFFNFSNFSGYEINFFPMFLMAQNFGEG